MSEGIPSPSIELGVDAERLRASGLPTKIFVLDSAQILQLHEILPEEATITELGRLRFFNVSFNGEILLFATTPIEEMVIDHWKELQKDKRKKPNTDPFVRLGSGRASVNKFTNMRTSEYLIQGFTMSKVRFPEHRHVCIMLTVRVTWETSRLGHVPTILHSHSPTRGPRRCHLVLPMTTSETTSEFWHSSRSQRQSGELGRIARSSSTSEVFESPVASKIEV